MRLILLVIIFLPLLSFAQRDTTYHYYVNGDISVVITPWENGRRMISLFDLKGNKTYSTEEIRLSYSVKNSFEFYDNGGVKKMIETTNPGASRYHFETTITFSSTNEPQYKETKRIPEEVEDLGKQSVFYWHKKSKSWKKQESVIFDPPKD